MSVQFGPNVTMQGDEDIRLSFVLKPTIGNTDKKFNTIIENLNGRNVSEVGLGIYRADVPAENIKKVEGFDQYVKYVGKPDTDASIEKG